MRTLLQIDTCLNSRSTGRIAEQIGVIAQKNDYKCYIAYGRYATKSQNIPIKIGNKLNTYWHKVETLVFDRDIFGSLYPTKRLIKQIEEIKPDIIQLHNLHGFYINIRVLFEYLSKKDIPIVWTLHDCWTFTGHCSHFDYIHCDKWKTLCHHCPQKTSYPMSLLLDNSKNNYLNKRKLFNSVKNITFVPVSYWLESLLKQSFLSKYPTNVIQNGTDIHTFHRINTPQNQLKKKYNLQNKFIILGVASIWTPRKGLQEFIKLSPGLVGGHCISVDPYYLIQKAQVYGVLPRVMSNARRLNDGMGSYVANQTIKCMNKKGSIVKDAEILILGITFKENCPDIRNTKVVDIYHTLREYTANITIYDPWANIAEVKKEYEVETTQDKNVLNNKYDAIILAVAHEQFKTLDVRNMLKTNGVVYDVKGFLPRNIVDDRL